MGSLEGTVGPQSGWLLGPAFFRGCQSLASGPGHAAAGFRALGLLMLAWPTGEHSGAPGCAVMGPVSLDRVPVCWWAGLVPDIPGCGA